MAASIDVTGLTRFSLNVQRAMAGDLQKALVKNIQDNEQPIRADMSGHAHTKIQKRAYASVAFKHTAVGLDISWRCWRGPVRRRGVRRSQGQEGRLRHQVPAGPGLRGQAPDHHAVPPVPRARGVLLLALDP